MLLRLYIVNAGKSLVMESTKLSVENDLIHPIFIGNKSNIENCANDLNGIYLNMRLLMKKMKITLPL